MIRRQVLADGHYYRRSDLRMGDGFSYPSRRGYFTESSLISITWFI